MSAGHCTASLRSRNTPFPRQPDPTPAEIAVGTAAIRERWTEAERLERERGIVNPQVRNRKAGPSPSKAAQQARTRRAVLARCYQPRPIKPHSAEPTPEALAVEAAVQTPPEPPAPAPRPRFLRGNSRQVTLWLPQQLYDRLESMLGPAPVAGLLSDLIHGYLAERESGVPKCA